MIEWKKAVSDRQFKELIEVSNEGNVRRHTDSGIVNYKVVVNSRGYPQITIRCVDGSRCTTTVHKLIGLTFLDYKKGLIINHKDGNRLNNRVKNLEWVTRKENCIHGAGLTTHRRSRDITDIEVLEIVDFYMNNDFMLDVIAIRYNLSRETLRTLINKRAKNLLTEKEYNNLRVRHFVIKQNKPEWNM